MSLWCGSSESSLSLLCILLAQRDSPWFPGSLSPATRSERRGMGGGGGVERETLGTRLRGITSRVLVSTSVFQNQVLR